MSNPVKNCMFAFPDRVIPNDYVTPVLSGPEGGWVEEGDVSLANLQNPDRSLVARSVDADPNNTVIEFDLGTERSIQAMALLDHNLSLEALVRYTFFTSADRNVLVDGGDSDVLPVWLTFFPPATLPWGHPSLWDGKILPEDRNGRNFDFIRTLSAMVVSRWGRLEITDPNNPNGFIELSRMPLAPAWQPARNMSWGASIKYESNATSDRSRYGKRYVDETALWREVTCRLQHIEPGVAESIILEMQYHLGKTGELLFIFDPTDQYQAMWQRSFLAQMEELNPIDYVGFRNNETGFKLVERL